MIGNQRSQRRFHLAETQAEKQFCSELSEQRAQGVESLGSLLLCRGCMWAVIPGMVLEESVHGLKSITYLITASPRLVRAYRSWNFPWLTQERISWLQIPNLPSSAFANSGLRLGNGKIQNLVASNGCVLANIHQVADGEPGWIQKYKDWANNFASSQVTLLSHGQLFLHWWQRLPHLFLVPEAAEALEMLGAGNGRAERMEWPSTSRGSAGGGKNQNYAPTPTTNTH